MDTEEFILARQKVQQRMELRRLEAATRSGKPAFMGIPVIPIVRFLIGSKFSPLSSSIWTSLLMGAVGRYVQNKTNSKKKSSWGMNLGRFVASGVLKRFF